MRPNTIKQLLRLLRSELSAEFSPCEYLISQRHVPYVRVCVKQQRYQIAYFAEHNFFRVFDTQQNYRDCATRQEVLLYLKSL